MLLKHLKFFNLACKTGSFLSSFLLRWDPKARRLYHVDNFKNASKILLRKSYLVYCVILLLLTQAVHAFSGESANSFQFFDKFVFGAVIVHFWGPPTQQYSVRKSTENIRLYINGIVQFSEKYKNELQSITATSKTTLLEKLSTIYTFGLLPSPIYSDKLLLWNALGITLQA